MASCSNRRDEKMRKSGEDTSDTDLLLHPELLSRDFLELVLHEKKINTEDGEDHDHLTELYIQHVIPLPQRELPKNRWGKRVERTNPRQTSTAAHSGSSTDCGRKRPFIVFDGNSTKTGSIKLKRTDDLPVTDRLKSPPSSINLINPIRKLSGSSANSSQASAGSARSPTGNGSMSRSSAPSSAQSDCMSSKLKRGASSSGVPESPELKSPEVKKKIQHVTWP